MTKIRKRIQMANAGVNTFTPSHEVSEPEYDVQFAINTRDVFFGVQTRSCAMADPSP